MYFINVLSILDFDFTSFYLHELLSASQFWLFTDIFVSYSLFIFDTPVWNIHIILFFLATVWAAQSEWGSIQAAEAPWRIWTKAKEKMESRRA